MWKCVRLRDPAVWEMCTEGNPCRREFCCRKNPYLGRGFVYEEPVKQLRKYKGNIYNINKPTNENVSLSALSSIFREESYFLVYYALQPVESQATFQRNVSPPSSDPNNKPSKKPAWKQAASRPLHINTKRKLILFPYGWLKLHREDIVATVHRRKN
jgi:hypothetical protein